MRTAFLSLTLLGTVSGPVSRWLQAPTLSPVSISVAESRTRLDKTAQAAFVKLRTAKLLAVSNLGRGGGLTPEVKAFQQLVKHPQGEEAFQMLLRAGQTPEARAYAVVGLLTRDPADPGALAALKTYSKLRVHSASGCVHSIDRFAQAVKQFTAPSKATPRL